MRSDALPRASRGNKGRGGLEKWAAVAARELLAPFGKFGAAPPSAVSIALSSVACLELVVQLPVCSIVYQARPVLCGCLLSATRSRSLPPCAHTSVTMQPTAYL